MEKEIDISIEIGKLLTDVMRCKFGTKNRAELIQRLQNIYLISKQNVINK